LEEIVELDADGNEIKGDDEENKEDGEKDGDTQIKGLDYSNADWTEVESELETLRELFPD
jgi:hypothetical protein